MGWKTKNHDKIMEAIEIISEHDWIQNRAKLLLADLKKEMTKKEEEDNPDLLNELEMIAW